MKTRHMLAALFAAGLPLPLSAQAMDHSQMDHSQMDHGSMSDPANEPVPPPPPAAPPAHDHSQMDHSQMGHDKMDHSQHRQQMPAPSSKGPSIDYREGCFSVGGMLEDGSMIDGMKCNPASGSGTSRIPGWDGGHSGLHVGLGENWMAMAHGYVWGVYTHQSGPRGDDKAYVQSMGMLMAERETGWGRIQFKSMFSLEPLMKNSGYPNLFATGETAGGEPLVDRQHPHDLFMELAARIDINIANDTRLFLYGGPVGEPAIGPSAFMHRGSARYNPEAPITHHWFDSSHITYGVATAGIATSRFQLEGSAFTGREPDEKRWNIEKPRFDSWAVRASWSPNANWVVQASTARFKQPEASHIGEDEQRTTASIQYADRRGIGGSGGGLSAMLAFSAKNRLPGRTLTAWLAEASYDLGEHHTLFGRIENVRNDELFPDHADPLHDRPFRVTKFQAGYAWRTALDPDERFNLALGGSASAFAKPGALDAAYGKNPMGATVFAKLSLGH